MSDLNTLLGALKPRVAGARGTLIGIEGHSTAGKTTLARDLALACGGERISTDTYVDRESDADAYADRILLEKLKADLTGLRAKHTVVFIEGICLRDTLRRLAVVPQTFVYCKRITQAGLWPDDPQNYLDENGLPQSTLSPVDRLSVTYHLRAQPLENADLVYARHET